MAERSVYIELRKVIACDELGKVSLKLVTWGGQWVMRSLEARCMRMERQMELICGDKA